MPLTEVGDAVLGFADAYARVAIRVRPEASTRLYLSELRSGSFDLVILTSFTAAQAAGGDLVAEAAKAAAREVLRRLIELVGLKKHTRGARFAIHAEGEGNVVNIVNIENVTLTAQRETAELLRDRVADRALDEITAPLAAGRIEAVEIATEGETPIGAKILSREREFFRLRPVPLSSREASFTGTIVSLNKNTARGRFRPNDGRSMSFHYIGEDPWGLYAAFAYRGVVRISGAAEFDETGKPVSIDIATVERLD